MARLSPLAAGFGAFTRSLEETDAKKRAQQERLEDRLAQKEMRELQKRSLEQALNAPAVDPLVVTLDDQGNPVHTPRSQAAGRRAPRPAEPLEVVIDDSGKPTYTPRGQAAGKEAPRPAEPLVQTVGTDGQPVYTRRSEAEGARAPLPSAATGAADKRKRSEALGNVSAALDSFENTLKTVGSQVMPGVDKDVLQTDYENLQLQLKELFNLGVLNGPDLALMRRIIQDPTSFRGRALAAGSGDEQAKRVLAQVGQMRAKLSSFAKNVDPASSAPDYSGMTDEQFAAEMIRSGKYKKP